MTDIEAHDVAEKTLLAWARERNAGNAENLNELTSPDTPSGWVSDQLSAVEQGDKPPQWDIVATSGFTRNGTVWTMNGFGTTDGAMFTFRIGDDGRLRIYSRTPVPLPTS
ncbi:hypothetical protein [Mycolicibacterium peregrinum]|nr:hypothetical protein [Mycolicibacterium peregrinum]